MVSVNIAMQGRSYIIGLGSNRGDRTRYIHAAVRKLDQIPGVSVERISRICETPALGPKQSPYLNAAVLIRSSHSPFELLRSLQWIEHELGRKRHRKWEPRTIDLDILWAEHVQIRHRRLRIPHARLFRRDFAINPLLELLPHLAPQRRQYSGAHMSCIYLEPCAAQLRERITGLNSQHD